MLNKIVKQIMEIFFSITQEPCYVKIENYNNPNLLK